jgi:Fe-S cluster assembly iron-binding protein IscA
MLQITDGAKAELKRLLETSVDWPGARLRLMDRGGGGLGLGVDIEAESDEIIEYEGARILVIGTELSSRLDRILLDIDATPQGVTLVIDER